MGKVSKPGLNFAPCSSKHKSCSLAHSNLVSMYREERLRQESIREQYTFNYSSDTKFYAEKFGQLINFRDWLLFNRKIT